MDRQRILNGTNQPVETVANGTRNNRPIPGRIAASRRLHAIVQAGAAEPVLAGDGVDRPGVTTFSIHRRGVPLIDLYPADATARLRGLSRLSSESRNRQECLDHFKTPHGANDFIQSI